MNAQYPVARRSIVFDIAIDFRFSSLIISDALPHYQRWDAFGLGAGAIEQSIEQQMTAGWKNKSHCYI